jgi:hypothetical protein
MDSWYRKEMLEKSRPDCANCGKKNGGYMSSTEWRHNHLCCSNACGMRLKKRIENKMVDLDNGIYFYSLSPFGRTNEDRIESLRNRIKHLEHQLRRNNIRPIRW